MKDQFNNNQYQARKDNDYVLSLYYNAQGGSTFISFDFMTRTMVTRNGRHDSGLSVTPFSQLDRDMLVNMRDTLIELQGNPPELPPEEGLIKVSPKKFSL
ncbi:MAG: hypothetical protein ACAH83_11385 [Alphaproteobacteria bacterium]